MKRSSLLHPWTPSCALIAAFAMLQTCALSAADPGYGPPREQQSGFGDKIGGFFRHLFYGESGNSRTGDPPPPPQRGRRQHYGASADRYNLDAPPSYAPSASVNGAATDESDAPPPPSRKQDSAKAKTESRANETKTKPRQADTRKKSEPAEPVRNESPKVDHSTKTPPAPEIKKDKSRETTPPVKIVNDSPPPAPSPPTKEPEPDANSAPPPRNTPGTSPTPDETEKKVVQNNAPQSGSKPAARDSKEVLTATKTDNPNRVKSPYPPFTELDVTGLQSGSSALDPTSQRIFRVP